VCKIKELANGDPENVPGFKTLNDESQEQVIKSFKLEDVNDRTFSGKPPSALFTAEDYRVEQAKSSRSTCKHENCGQKILKFDLRLGYMPTVKPGLHASWKWYHWYASIVLY